MNLKGIVAFIPDAELLSAQKTGHAVSIVPAGVEKEPCLGEGVCIGLEARWMRPLDGDCG